MSIGCDLLVRNPLLFHFASFPELCRILGAGIRWGSEGSWFIYHFTQPTIVCYNTLICLYRNEKMQSIVGMDSKHMCCGRYNKILCSWRLDFDHKLDLSIERTSPRIDLSTIHWLCQVSVCMRSLEMAWWWNDSAGIVCFWLMFYVLAETCRKWS